MPLDPLPAESVHPVDTVCTAWVDGQDAEVLADWFLEMGAASVSIVPAEPHDPCPDRWVLEPALDTMPVWDQVCLVSHWASARDHAAVWQQLAADPRVRAWTQERLPDTNWVAATQSMEPLCFDGFSIQPVGQAGGHTEAHKRVVWLDPGCGFGTGQHPTTFLCVSYVVACGQSGALVGKRVLDFGSGTGILGLSALCWGASALVAVDHDPQARDATWRNACRNGWADRVVIYPDLESVPESFAADYLCANVLAQPLLDHRHALLRRLAPTAHGVLSGILRTQADALRSAYDPTGTGLETVYRDHWAALQGRFFPDGPMPAGRSGG